MKFFAALVFLTLASSAFADQCQIVSKKQAIDSMEFLKPGSKIGFLCELCGETAMKKVTIRSVAIRGSAGASEVIVNGKGIDLAYTYTLVNKSRYYNIAGLVGCPTTGVTFDIPVKK